MWKIILIIVAVFVFIYAYHIEPNRLRLSEVTIGVDGLSKELNGLTILHLSDLHLTKIGKREEKLLQIVNGINADILVITGDFVNSRAILNECIQMIGRFKARYGKFGVWGNEDYRILNSEDRNKLASADIQFLVNENKKMNLENLWLIGVDDPFIGRDDLSSAIKGIPEEDFKILLTHSPAISRQASEYGVDLILAGHTHGGQIYIPLISHLIVRLLGGGGYIAGLYQIRDTFLYVSRGIGMSILPFRAFCPPEVVLIKLKAGRWK